MHPLTTQVHQGHMRLAHSVPRCTSAIHRSVGRHPAPQWLCAAASPRSPSPKTNDPQSSSPVPVVESAAESSGQGNEPNNEGKGPLSRLLASLYKYEATRGLAEFAQKLIVASTTQPPDQRVLRIARAIFLIMVLAIVVMMREAGMQSNRVKPREVGEADMIS